MIPLMYLPPQKLQCSMGIQEFLTNSPNYLCTFQLFIDATKITNFRSKQHNLFLECGNNLMFMYTFTLFYTTAYSHIDLYSIL